jgi:DNA-binding transcriptional ArsR family regulator
MIEPQQLDRVFIALSDAGRRGMVERLSRGPATVKQLAEPHGMRLPSALKHLKVLEDGGIVTSHKVGRTRTYTIEPTALAGINDWVRQRQTAMNQAFDRLVQAMKDFPEEQDQ